jgi:hypothetical protein
MLIPTNLKQGSKERKEYVEKYQRHRPIDINKGPRATLRPPGGNNTKVEGKK